MTSGPQAGGALVEWGVSHWTYPGEEMSGDLQCVIETPEGVFAAVVDGLGHGEEAGAAAKQAVQVLSKGKIQALPQMFQDCHTALRRTRGVVMSAAWISAIDQSLTWLGVGNVDGSLLRGPMWEERISEIKGNATKRMGDTHDAAAHGIPGRESLLVRGGVLGYRIPTLRAVSLPIRPGDTLIFTTDGITLDFQRFTTKDLAPQAIADDILAEFRKGTDDALVLVVRYTGGNTDD